MITIRESLHLNSLTPLTLQSDALSRKLAGNYRLLDVSVTAQELLHMTQQRPEIYVELENNSMVCIEQRNKWDNSVRMEMMNQFFNRILCIHTPQFTYQDEVYLTTVLRKMGIRDVKEFIGQAKAIIRQSELTKRLAEQYSSKEEELKEIMETVFGQETFRTGTEFGQETFRTGMVFRQEKLREFSAGVSLQNQIFSRLQTETISHALYRMREAYYNSRAIVSEYVSLIQQKQLADEIRISRIRQEIYRQDNAFFMRHDNCYEHGNTGMLTEEITEENLYKQISAAILINLVRQLSYGKAWEQDIRKESWQDYTNIFYGSAADVFQLIQNNQTENTLLNSRMSVYMDEMNLLYQDEAVLLENLELLPIGDTSEYFELSKNYIRALLETQNLIQQRAALEEAAFSYLKNYGRSEWMEEERKWLKVLRMQEDALLEYLADGTKFLEFTEGMETSLMHILAKYENRERSVRYTGEIYRENQTILELQPYLEETRILDRITQTENQEEQQKIYLEYLTQVNEHNVRMQQLISEHVPTVQEERHIVINKELAKQNMRKALEHPGALLEEIYEAPQSARLPIPAHVQYLLQLADEPVRMLYEKALGISVEEGTVPSDFHLAEIDSGRLQELLEAAQLQQMRQTRQIERTEEMHHAWQTEETQRTEETRRTEEMHRKQQTERVRHTYQKEKIQHFVHIIENIEKRRELFHRQEQAAIQILRQLMTESETTEALVPEIDKRQTKQFLTMEIIDMAQTAMQMQESETDFKNEGVILEREQLSLVHRMEMHMEEALHDRIKTVLQDTTLQSEKSELLSQTQRNQEEKNFIKKNNDIVEHEVQKQLQETKQEILKENKSMIQTLVQDHLTSQMKNISNRVYRDL